MLRSFLLQVKPGQIFIDLLVINALHLRQKLAIDNVLGLSCISQDLSGHVLELRFGQVLGFLFGDHAVFYAELADVLVHHKLKLKWHWILKGQV